MMLALYYLVALSAVALAERLTEAPATVYEAEEISPQNGDYDKVNKLFPAHQCWYNDKMIHYAKFRIYAPPTYPETIMPGGTNKIPIGRVAIATTTGDASGVVASAAPILEFHHADGESYSDFVEIVWLKVDAGADVSDLKAFDELPAADLTPSGLFANMPLVPTGSAIAHPDGGDKRAPIEPVWAYYRGVKVQTFVFEVSDAKLKTVFASSRSDSSAAFGITVVGDLVSAARNVLLAPLWHLNQNWRGVTPGVNSGGPNPAGQRNIVRQDRGDAGYSPLWVLQWATQLPLGYEADDARNPDVLTEQNGFKFVATPMYVNCPDLGEVKTPSDSGASSFGLTYKKGETVVLQGALVFEADIELQAKAGDVELVTGKTNGMGGYVLEFAADKLAAGANTVSVVQTSDWKEIGSFKVMVAAHADGKDDDDKEDGKEDGKSAPATGESDDEDEDAEKAGEPSDSDSVGRATLAGALVAGALALRF